MRDKPPAKVTAALKTWVAKLDRKDKNHDLHLCEGLWVQQGHHTVDREFLSQVLKAKSPEARAAATHVLADEWEYLAGPRTSSSAVPMDLLRPQVKDSHARVRLEALRALSFIETLEAVELALEVTRQPTDYWIDYTLQHTVGALEGIWKPAFQRGELAKNNPSGREYLDGFLSGRPQLGAAKQHIRDVVHWREINAKQRDRAMKQVVGLRGKADIGKQVFERSCVACHRVGSTGAEFGPDLTKVATRLKRQELIESIVDPNAKLDPKFLAVNITTKDGEEISGMLATEDSNTVTVVLGGGTKQVVKKENIAVRQTLKVSSMPDGLAEGLSPEEFIDLVEYLAAQK